MYIYFCLNCLLTINFTLFRHQHSIQETYEVFPFANETSTSTLWAHLIAHHLGVWVDGCDKFKISITAERAKAAVAQYRESRGDRSTESAQAAGNRPPDIPEYSYEAFIDAITKFVIADNQVHHQIFLKRSRLMR